MSMISKDGLIQIKIIKNALDSMYDKLNNTEVYTKTAGKVKDIEKQYTPANLFGKVQDEFEAIAGIVALTDEWKEV